MLKSFNELFLVFFTSSLKLLSIVKKNKKQLIKALKHSKKYKKQLIKALKHSKKYRKQLLKALKQVVVSCIFYYA
jgi:hypothetical protein